MPVLWPLPCPSPFESNYFGFRKGIVIQPPTFQCRRKDLVYRSVVCDNSANAMQDDRNSYGRRAREGERERRHAHVSETEQR